MRKLSKLQKPAILEEKEEQWLRDVNNDPTETNKTRYRHSEIKSRLHQETFDKCIYCESKILPTAQSQIEHKIPVSKRADLRFSWENLTICCPECNRRKGNFHSMEVSFIDPYQDDVEDRIIHRGPIVGWKLGDQSAELSVRCLGLDGYHRIDLIMNKVEKIAEVDDLAARYHQTRGGPLEPYIKQRLKGKADISAEYSAMVRSLFAQAGLLDLLK